MSYIKTAFDVVSAVIVLSLLNHFEGVNAPPEPGRVALALVIVALLRINVPKKAAP